MSRFPDQNDATLPDSVNRIKAIPLQFSSAEEAEVVDWTGKVALGTTASTSGFIVFLKWYLQASLSLLWGMLNSQQMVVRIPMYSNLKFPANSMLVVEYMI